MVQTPEPETYSLPPAAPFANHGRTRAGWVLMWGVCIGFLVAGVGLAASMPVVAIIGAVIAVLAVVVSQVMRAMGMGQPDAHPADAQEQDWYGSPAARTAGPAARTVEPSGS